jgi:putative FmdB family regulatory protein
MPLYEYKCQSCGDVFEVIQKFSDQPLAIHPKCGGPVERLISPSALQFKGSGWYVNDYGKGNSNESKAKKDAANGASKSDKSASSSTESSSKSDTAASTPAPAKSDSGSKPDSK